MGNRINTVMQPCFFSLSGVLPADEAIARIKDSVKKTYAKRGEAVVQRNFAAIDASLARMTHVTPGPVEGGRRRSRRSSRPRRPTFVRDVTAKLIAGDGDLLPVSAMPVDGTFPIGHHALREAGDRAVDPDLGPVDLHRLRQVRDGLPARVDPHEGLPGGRAGRRRASRARSSSPATCRTT